MCLQLWYLEEAHTITCSTLAETVEPWCNHKDKPKMKCIVTGKKYYHKVWTSWASLVAQQWRARLWWGWPGFDPWVGRNPWRREWQPTPVILAQGIPWTEDPGEWGSSTVHRVTPSWTRLNNNNECLKRKKKYWGTFQIKGATEIRKKCSNYP